MCGTAAALAQRPESQRPESQPHPWHSCTAGRSRRRTSRAADRNAAAGRLQAGRDACKCMCLCRCNVALAAHQRLSRLQLPQLIRHRALLQLPRCAVAVRG